MVKGDDASLEVEAFFQKLVEISLQRPNIYKDGEFDDLDMDRSIESTKAKLIREKRLIILTDPHGVPRYKLLPQKKPSC